MKAKLFHADRQTDRQADGHDEANNRFSQFGERAWEGWTAVNQNKGMKNGLEGACLILKTKKKKKDDTKKHNQHEIRSR